MILAGIVNLLFKKKSLWNGMFSAGILFLSLILVILQIQNFLTWGDIHESFSFTPTMSFGILVDGVSSPFVFAVVLISFLSCVFSIPFMKKAKNQHLYYANLLFFAAGMLGLVLSTNFIEFYMFWEVMVIPSYFLISYWGHGKAQKIGFKYFIYMHIAALLILVSFLWIYSYTGSFLISSTVGLSTMVDLSVLKWMFSLLMIGFGIKMALWPLHWWLPDAHSEAPAPISAMLSGVMIMTGAYGIIRILTPFFGTILASVNVSVLMPLALLTMWIGGMLALAQNDIKRLFAYSSISQIGYIFFGLMTLTTTGKIGSIFHIVNHSIVKAMGFFICGAIIYSTDSRDIKSISGLFKKMPIVCGAAIITALALAGTPPFNIFMSEWMIFLSGIETGSVLYSVIGIFASVLTAAYGLWFVKRVFFGRLHVDHREIRDIPLLMQIVLIFCSILVIIIGVYPQIILQMIR